MLKKIDLSRIDLNLLVLFEAVLEERHVARTAVRLHLSASAVSHGLGRLRRLFNDPLFLKHPKGVAPTTRALQLKEPIAEVLARTRGIIAGVQSFDPATSTRRFVIGAPDAVSSVALPPFLAALGQAAPGIDVSIRFLMPQHTLATLDANEVDIAIAPFDTVPPRFATQELYAEEFVIAMRVGHVLAGRLTLENYCASSHAIVSTGADPKSPVDDLLKQQGLTRRLALSAPSFLFALSAVGETDLLAAVPRRLVQKCAKQFGVTYAEPPRTLSPMLSSRIQCILPKAALMDSGTRWLFELLGRTAKPAADFGSASAAAKSHRSSPRQKRKRVN